MHRDWALPGMPEDTVPDTGPSSEDPGVEDGEDLSEELTYPGFARPELGADGCLIARPGEDFEVLDSMPRRLHEKLALVLWHGELTAVHGSHGDMVRTPIATDVVDDAMPLATRIVLVTIRHRMRPPRTWPLRYVVLTNGLGELLGWLDHSPPSWDFQTSQIKILCDLARMECAAEVYESEAEFAQAHPAWSR